MWPTERSMSELVKVKPMIFSCSLSIFLTVDEDISRMPLKPLCCISCLFGQCFWLQSDFVSIKLMLFSVRRWLLSFSLKCR